MSKNANNDQAYIRWEQFQNNLLDEIKTVDQLNVICTQLENDSISKGNDGMGVTPEISQSNNNFESDLRNERPIVRREFVPQQTPP